MTANFRMAVTRPQPRDFRCPRTLDECIGDYALVENGEARNELGRFQVADEIEGRGLFAPQQISLPHEEVSATTWLLPNRRSKRRAA
jgi:hypothetical protein